MSLLLNQQCESDSIPTQYRHTGVDQDPTHLHSIEMKIILFAVCCPAVEDPAETASVRSDPAVVCGEVAGVHLKVQANRPSPAPAKPPVRLEHSGRDAAALAPPATAKPKTDESDTKTIDEWA